MASEQSNIEDIQLAPLVHFPGSVGWWCMWGAIALAFIVVVYLSSHFAANPHTYREAVNTLHAAITSFRYGLQYICNVFKPRMHHSQEDREKKAGEEECGVEVESGTASLSSGLPPPRTQCDPVQRQAHISCRSPTVALLDIGTSITDQTGEIISRSEYSKQQLAASEARPVLQSALESISRTSSPDDCSLSSVDKWLLKGLQQQEDQDTQLEAAESVAEGSVLMQGDGNPRTEKVTECYIPSRAKSMERP